jgi:hypothetical protein
LLPGERQVARVARQETPLPVCNAFARGDFVLLLGVAKNGQLRVPPVDEGGVPQQGPKGLVTPLQGGILDGDLSQGVGMWVEELDAIAMSTREGLRLGFLHGIHNGAQEVERQHHQNVGLRVGAL